MSDIPQIDPVLFKKFGPIIAAGKCGSIATHDILLTPMPAEFETQRYNGRLISEIAYEQLPNQTHFWFAEFRGIDKPPVEQFISLTGVTSKPQNPFDYDRFIKVTQSLFDLDTFMDTLPLSPHAEVTLAIRLWLKILTETAPYRFDESDQLTDLAYFAMSALSYIYQGNKAVMIFHYKKPNTTDQYMFPVNGVWAVTPKAPL